MASAAPLEEQIAHHYSEILRLLGEEARPGIVDTPMRAAKAMMRLTSSKRGPGTVADVIGTGIFAEPKPDSEWSGGRLAPSPTIVRGIEFSSLCEHHMLPFYGVCHVGYIANGTVLGLSKFARIVDHCSHKLQIQEGLTIEILEAVVRVTNCEWAAVVIDSAHMCMKMRGVEKQCSTTVTSRFWSSLSDAEAKEAKEEFYRNLQLTNTRQF